MTCKTACCFLFLVFLAQGMPAEPVRLSLQLLPELADQATSDVQLLLTHEEAPKEALSPITIPAKAQGEVVFDLPPETRWHLMLQSEHFWTPPREIAASEETTPIRIYPAGYLTGEVRVPEPDALPTSLTLMIQPTHGRRWDAEVTCPITGGRFRCTVPAIGGLDLRLFAAPYIAHYFWDQAVVWEETTDLGVLALRPGASVIGWTTHSDGTVDFDHAVITLSPWVANFAEADRRQLMVDLEATVNERGFFQFQGVPPGSYRLAVRHPRFATARMDRLEILAGQEHELDAMELWPLATLVVEVAPTTDPFQQPWQVRLQTLRAIQQGQVRDSGSWQVDGLEYDTYRVSLHDSRGNVWAEEQVPVLASWVTHRITVQTTHLEIRFLLGGKPVTDAEVTFQGRGGNSHHRRTNEDGTAYVFLQAGRTWQIQVNKPEEGIRGTFGMSRCQM